MIINLQANWIESVESGAEIEKALGQKEGWFKGAGWYLFNKEHLLIVPIYDTEEPFASKNKGPWRIYNYGPDIGMLLGMVSHAPVRQDERKGLDENWEHTLNKEMGW